MTKEYKIEPYTGWRVLKISRETGLKEVGSYVFPTEIKALKTISSFYGDGYLYTTPEPVEISGEVLQQTLPSWIVYIEGKGYFDGEIVFHEDGKSDVGNTIYSEKAYLFYDEKAAQAVAYLVKGETVPSGEPGYFIK